MSDVAVMAAIIGQHCRDDYDDPIPKEHLKSAAQALYDAGYRMVADDADAALIKRLRSTEDRLTRIEGYMVIPTHYTAPGG